MEDHRSYDQFLTYLLPLFLIPLSFSLSYLKEGIDRLRIKIIISPAANTSGLGPFPVLDL